MTPLWAQPVAGSAQPSSGASGVITGAGAGWTSTSGSSGSPGWETDSAQPAATDNDATHATSTALHEVMLNQISEPPTGGARRCTHSLTSPPARGALTVSCDHGALRGLSVAVATRASTRAAPGGGYLSFALSSSASAFSGSVFIASASAALASAFLLSAIKALV